MKEGILSQGTLATIHQPDQEAKEAYWIDERRLELEVSVTMEEREGGASGPTLFTVALV